jgi:hypothetical protein
MDYFPLNGFIREELKPPPARIESLKGPRFERADDNTNIRVCKMFPFSVMGDSGSIPAVEIHCVNSE